MTTTIPTHTDITPVPTQLCLQRGSRALKMPFRLKPLTVAEIAEVEWLRGWLTTEEIARAVGRISAAALVRFLQRAGRPDLGIEIQPIPLDTERARQAEDQLQEARWRAVTEWSDTIGWALAWSTAGRAAADRTIVQELAA